MNPFDADESFNDIEKQLRNLDPAWAKAALAFRTGHRFGHGDSIRCQPLIAVHQMLEARRKRYQAGDTMELLHAVKLCAEENLPLPEWLALAFNGRFAQIGKVGGATSLDAIFYSPNLPTKTPKKAAQAQQDWQLGARIWAAVWKVAAAHNGLSPALDEVLAAGNFGVKKTTATRLVNMIDETQSSLTGRQSLSQFWARRRKQ